MQKRMLLGVMVLCFFFSSSVAFMQTPAPATQSDVFDLQEVAPQVWALIVKQNSPVNAVSNAAFFTIGDHVAVVDSHFTPAAARQASRIISSVTGGKPIHFLINTHWHPDHVQGNSTYSSLFPQALDIIAHTNTRRDIAEKEVASLRDLKESLPKDIEKIRGQLQSGKTAEGADLKDDQRQQLQNRLKSMEGLRADVENLEVTLPNITFDRSLYLNNGEREVQVLYFGRGHTAGDVVVYLPKEKVVITGDLLTGSIPFMRDAYPPEWSATLAGVEKLDFDRVIPGHGAVQQGKERLGLLRAFLDDLVAAVKTQSASGKKLDEIKSSVKLSLTDKYSKQFSNFNSGVDAAVERTYSQLAGK